MPKAFVVAFEVGRRLGDGFGGPVTERGLHATAVFGRLGEAAAGAALLGVDSAQTSSALGAVATSVGADRLLLA